MKTCYLVIALSIVFPTINYCQSETNNITVIESDFDKACILNMSEIFSGISYIPLETNTDCLIGNISVLHFGHDILLRTTDGSDQIYRFSREGEFLNKIGKKGRGPGEYTDISDVTLSDGIVYVVSGFSRSISCYSLEGTFIKKHSLSFNGSPSSAIRMPDGSFFLALSNTIPEGRLIRTDRNFNILSGFLKNNPIPHTPYPLSFSKPDKEIFYYYTVVDTIFEIASGNPKPAYILDHGKYNKPIDFISIPGDFGDDDKYPQIVKCEVSNNYLSLFLLLIPGNRVDYLLYRITDGKTYNILKLIDDIDNGTVDRWFGQLTSDDHMVFSLMPSTILSRFQEMTKKERLDPKNSGFVDMASRITLDSNPVLMICKLK